MIASCQESYDKPRQCIKKQRHYSANKTEILLCQIVKAMVFPMVTYSCKSWTVRKAEHQRIDAFKLWGCGGLQRVPWTVRRSNQSILGEINPAYSLEGLKLKLQYSGHLL